MPKRSNAFQRLVLAIEQMLSAERATVRESVELPDRVSNTPREVDILIEGDLCGYPVRIALECTDESRPADVTWIDRLVGKYRDLPIDRVVAVARAGFTAEAIRKAASSRVDTLTLDQSVSEDWLRRFRLIRFECLSHSHQLTAVRMRYKTGPEPVAWEGVPEIVRRDGSVVGTLEQQALELYTREGLQLTQRHIGQKPWNELLPLGAASNTFRSRVIFDANDLIVRDGNGAVRELDRLTLVVESTVRLHDVVHQRYAYRNAGVVVGTVTKDDRTETLSVALIAPPDGNLARSALISLPDWKPRVTEDSNR